MKTLDPAQRRALRAQAHHLHPVVSIGQHGVTPAVLHEIDVNLLAHELVKIRVFSDDREAREAMLNEVCEALDAAPVQHLGKVLVLYRATPAEEPEVTAKPPRGERKSANGGLGGRERARGAQGANAGRAGSPTLAQPGAKTVRRRRVEPLTAGKARAMAGTSKRKPAPASTLDRRSPGATGKGASPIGVAARRKPGPSAGGKARAATPAAQRRSPAAAPSGVPRAPRTRRRRG